MEHRRIHIRPLNLLIHNRISVTYVTWLNYMFDLDGVVEAQCFHVRLLQNRCAFRF